MARFFLGIDGGQSSTIALIGDESGKVVGYGAGGPCNHARASEGKAKFTRAITECVGAACQQAGLDLETARFEVVSGGFSGGPDDKQPILAELLRAAQFVLETDAVIALIGATAGQPGIITIGGTGSIAFGRNASGKTARAGGWGYVYGDEGGGFDLARQGLRAALRAEEGWGPPTSLSERLLEAGTAKSANELLHKFYGTDFTRSQIAGFGALVARAAAEGDGVALGILRKAASDLALLASAVRHQLFKPGEAAHVAPLGGVFRSPVVREQFCALVSQEDGNRCAPAIHPPAAGALLEAYRVAGLTAKLSNVPDVKR